MKIGWLPPSTKVAGCLGTSAVLLDQVCWIRLAPSPPQCRSPDLPGRSLPETRQARWCGCDARAASGSPAQGHSIPREHLKKGFARTVIGNIIPTNLDVIWEMSGQAGEKGDTLSMAIPTTILYRLTFGGLDGNPPFEERDLIDVDEYFAHIGDLRILVTGPDGRRAHPDANTLKLIGRISRTIGSLGAVLLPVLDAAEDSAAILAPFQGIPLSKEWQVTLFALGTEIFVHATEYPFEQMFDRPDGQNSHDIAVIADWFAGMVPMQFSGLFFLATGSGLRGVPIAGPLVMCFFGCTRAMSGACKTITAVGEQEFLETIGGVKTISDSIPKIAKPLIPVAINAPIEIGLPAAATLLAGDIGFGYGAERLGVAERILEWSLSDTFVHPDDLDGRQAAWMFIPQEDFPGFHRGRGHRRSGQGRGRN